MCMSLNLPEFVNLSLCACINGVCVGLRVSWGFPGATTANHTAVLGMRAEL